MKRNLTGKNNPMYGRHHTEETRQKLREIRLKQKCPSLGVHHTKEWRQKQRKTRKEKFKNGTLVQWNKGLKKDTDSRVKRNGEACSKTKKLLYSSGELIIWNKGKKGLYHHSEETLKKLSVLNTGKNNKMYGVHLIPWNKGQRGIYGPETIKKISEARKKNWKQEEYVKKVMERAKIQPNGPELYLDFVLQNYFPDEWKYVGDGQVILNGLCPDFINCNGKKKIIEFFGEHWHANNKRRTLTESGRRQIFAQLGYDLLVIWDYDLDDEKSVIEKIREFTVSDSCH